MEKDYLKEGDVVSLRQEIANKPNMIVDKLLRNRGDGVDAGKLAGIRCFWFDSTGAIQKNIFYSKDLIRIGE